MCQPGRPRSDARLPESFTGLGSFPQREVAGIVLVVLVHVHARACFHAGEILLGELAVAGKLGDAEVIGTIVSAIGESLCGQFGDEVGHLGNVLGRAHDHLGRLEAQRLHVLAKGLLVFLGVLADADALLGRVADDFVVHVGDVHHVLELVAALPQKAPQQVHEDESAEVADVAVVVHRRAAGIHADKVVLLRLKLLHLGGQRVEQSQCHCEGELV